MCAATRGEWMCAVTRGALPARAFAVPYRGGARPATAPITANFSFSWHLRLHLGTTGLTYTRSWQHCSAAARCIGTQVWSEWTFSWAMAAEARCCAVVSWTMTQVLGPKPTTPTGRVQWRSHHACTVRNTPGKRTSKYIEKQWSPFLTEWICVIMSVLTTHALVRTSIGGPRESRASQTPIIAIRNDFCSQGLVAGMGIRKWQDSKPAI